MKKMTLAGLLTGIAFTLVMLIAILHNWDNKRHTVTFFQGSEFTNYENTEGVAQVNVSPAIAWDHTSGVAKFFGFVFLVAMWVGIYLIDTKLQDLPAGGKAAVFLLPLVISAALFFGGYSSKYVSNYKEVYKSRFDGWLQSGAIEQKGERTYIDSETSDTLKNLFNKPFIK